MTKAELVEAVAAQSRLTKKSAAEILDIVFANIGKAVKKDQRFSYPGFGTWSVRSRKARKIRNPQTNEMMKLKASKTDRLPARQGAEELAVVRGSPRARSDLTWGRRPTGRRPSRVSGSDPPAPALHEGGLLPGIGGAQLVERIARLALAPQLEVQVHARGQARLAGRAHHVALLEHLAGLHQHARQVAVAGGDVRRRAR